MKFSDTTNKNGIIQNIESLCKLGDAGVTGNSTLFAKITGYVNMVNQWVTNGLIECDQNWQFDDYNYADLPRGTTTLVAGQRDYTLPIASSGADASTLLGLQNIAILDSAGKERLLTLTDLDESQLNNDYATSGLPILYKLVGNSIKIWPAADSGTQVTLAAGLIAYFRRTPDPFTTSDTTQEPGFLSTFHHLLQLGASAQYLLPIDNKLALQYLTLFNTELERLQDAYVHANSDAKNQILPRRHRSR